MSRVSATFNCLIRTHHITSRKKVRRVRHAADQLGVDKVLIRSGGSPGIMFAESGDETSLVDWVAEVQALRYKDFRCVSRPALTEAVAPARAPAPSQLTGLLRTAGFHETESVAEFAKEMEYKGLTGWWKKAMGYTAEDK